MFRRLHPAAFKNRNLNVKANRQVYQVLSVLVHSSECWTLLCRLLNRVNAFHYSCVHIIHRQTAVGAAHHLGADLGAMRNVETTANKVMKCRLEWLDHMAWIPKL